MGKLFSIWLLESLVNLYDIVTLPLYYLIQQPWKVRQQATRVRARKVDENTWVNIDGKLDKSNRTEVETLDKLFRDSVATFSSKNCLAVRKILSIEFKNQNKTNLPNGLKSTGAPNDSNNKTTTTNQTISEISKYNLDDKYTWYTYEQIEDIVIRLSTGLVGTCKESLINDDGSRKLLICADTCMEWFLIAHACFRNNVTVVTAYTTLDDDAILHSLQQTEVKILVVCQKFIHRVPKIIESAPLVDTIIILDEPLPGLPDERDNLQASLGTATNVKRIISYNDLLNQGASKVETILSRPEADDVAVLMYTSGSTGKAKGVMLTHECIVYTAIAFSGPGDISHEDRYIGYLPLGHVLELAAECIFLRNGSTIAYSSPFTLTNSSPMVKEGQYGDAFIFKPTVMGAVPLVLDRIKSGVQQAIKSRGAFYDQLYNDFLIRYKRYWYERYYDTPIINFLLCRKLNKFILGGEIRAICSGGAALSRDTQEYLRFVTNYTVLQGYGLTETSAAASFCDIYDRRCNIVGAPYPIIQLRLESWSDYTIEDKPYPRGEIIIGGKPVAAGYYKNDELTKEAFFVDEKTGVRFFRSGDIGMMLPDGVLKIIDRKKDIVKPLSGEYISLSEIENAMKTAPIVENVCVYCSQYSNYVVALVKPDARELRNVAKELYSDSTEDGQNFLESLNLKSEANVLANGMHQQKVGEQNALNKPSGDERNGLDLVSIETLCSNQWLTKRVLALLQAEGKRKKLKRTHIPSRIKLVHEDWSPDSGLVTASFKLRRREVERFYAQTIQQLYADLGQKIDQNQTT